MNIICPENVCNTEQCGPSAPIICLEGKAVGGCATAGFWDKTPDCTMWCDTSQCKRTGNPCSKLTCDTHECGNDKPFLCLQGPSKGGCATEEYWKEKQSCTEWCDTSQCGNPGPAPGPAPGPSKCNIVKERMPPEVVRWRSTENCERMRKEIIPDLEGICPEYCNCSAANSDYPSDIENPNDNSCLFRPGGWGSCCDLTDSKDGPEEHNWRYATDVKSASCYSDGFHHKPECRIEPLRYIFGLGDPAIKGVTEGCGNWKNARDCLEYEDPNNIFSPCKKYGDKNIGPIPKKGEYCFQDFVEYRNFEEAEPELLHTAGFEQGACSNNYVEQTGVKHLYGWQWCRPNKNTSNRVCLTKDSTNRFEYGMCVDTENIGTRDYSEDNCKKDAKGNTYCTLMAGECDRNTNKCKMPIKFTNHNFIWDEYSQSSDLFANANGFADGDIPWEKCSNRCSNASQKCCD